MAIDLFLKIHKPSDGINNEMKGRRKQESGCFVVAVVFFVLSVLIIVLNVLNSIISMTIGSEHSKGSVRDNSKPLYSVQPLR